MLPPRIHVFADDLSGAAECAAVLARAAGEPVPMVLDGEPPTSGSWSLDGDTRAMPAVLAAQMAAESFRRAAADPGAVLFKKIDSTLRGHVTAELRATLTPGVVQSAIVCPALPAQRRTLRAGVLHVDDQPQIDRDGAPLDLLKLLAPADAQVTLVRPAPHAGVAQVARELTAATEAGARIVVVDASTDDDLRRLAQALLAAADGARWLPVGAAGLAKAIAAEFHASGTEAVSLAPDLRPGPLVTVVGSFNPVSSRQVDELAREPGVHVVRLNASLWLADPALVADEMATAQALASDGRSIVLAATGVMPVRSTRELVQRMAAAAEPLIRSSSALVMTGGDTARTVLDRLGIARVQVLGELAPGICISRSGADLPAIVTKAGGFGDSQSLVRVLRRLRAPLARNTSPERKE